eukprot:TRINITY_DN4772_c0_g4_i1.p1 TRINITY_DN4772_c0_g4~~TRINITY_DN4772_c0_g4_i1.p1  ORF type:complete len:161 (+),score=61.73 TRINITY_DN4772_c0_g4_i1:69-551(+)
MVNRSFMIHAQSLPQDFGYVMLAAIAIAFQCLLTGFAVGGARKKTKNEVKYPDMGYCKKDMDEKDWLLINNYQRAHYNYVESVAAAISFLVLSGLKYPRFAASCGAVYVVGRAAYSWGYQHSGPNGRRIGAVVLEVALLAMFLVAVYSSLEVVGFVRPLM